MINLQAIILAAGKSTRSYPLTVNCPKALLKIANKTIIEHNLDALQGLVNEAIIVVGFKKELIMEKLGFKHDKIKITYVIQKKQLGTGHALLKAKDIIKERFIFMNGDDLYSRKDIKNCLKHKYCVLVQKVKDYEKWGIVTVKNNKVISIVEKPGKFVGDLANTQLFVLDKSIFKFKLKKSKRGEYEVTDYITQLAKKQAVDYTIVQDYWLPVGYPWHVLEANEFMLKRLKRSDIKGKVEKGAVLKDLVIVGKGTVIRSGAYIEGPVMIGKNCKIGPNCYIRPCTTLADGCKVGNACEVKNSVCYENVSIGHLSYIGDSVIGESTNLGAGTIIANLKHDNANVKSMIQGKLIDTGRRKLGAIIGDHVHTGIHTSIYPGRNIWPNKTTLPGEIVKKDII